MRASQTTMWLAFALTIAAPAVGFGATRLQPAGSVAPAGSAAPAAANSCRKLPPGKRMVKLNLKPDTSLPDLVAWISAITCKDFLLSSGGAIDNAKVTIVAPELLSTEDAYQLFLNALDSVGLTVYPSGKFMRIIETSKAKNSPIPSYVSTDDTD
jgi:general secretion pathway protein D